jgi:phage shock protein PspC (stress-responsive transcriptional regulator)
LAETRLLRSRTQRRIAGVCGGLARHFDTDPVFIRLGFVAAALIPPFAGAVIVGYLVAWLIVPEEDAVASVAPAAAGEAPAGAPGDFAPPAGSPGDAPPPPPAEPRPSSFPADASLVGGVIFIALGVFFLMLNLGLLPWDLLRFWRWRVLWPVVVIVLGAAMMLRSLRPQGGRSDGR